MGLNFEVRVLCCEPREGCPLSSVTPSVTSKYVSTTESPFVAPTMTSPSSAAPSTMTCYCSVSDKLFPAGSIVYQQVDLSGRCYYALCSLDCHVVPKADRVCPTSTPPTALKGETWAMPNCSQATCEGNNVITLQPRPCPQVQKPTCANGYPALKVMFTGLIFSVEVPFSKFANNSEGQCGEPHPDPPALSLVITCG
ncbi:mucin-5AC-like [Molossus nigricans]